ncbi:hypothetical protein TWF730_004396 [Orbilia blumenaviensis]|uniref:Extracellular membrane protein CFEM domain-containing protein n=1 Tax=Orbilia blumenaviensis TaxID=1796055 RepID=A0AAV9TYB6_9PEZI
MRTSTIILAGALAAVASAQGSFPPACTDFLTKTTECVPEDASEEDIVSPEVVGCICGDAAGFSRAVTDCLDAVSGIESFPADALTVLQGFEQYCQLLGGGGGGSSPGSSGSNTVPSATETETEPSPTSRGSGGGSTPTPTPTSIDTGSENCDYLLGGLQSCWTDGSALPTAAAVADCLCSGTSFDAAVEGCYSDIVNVSPKEASTISGFAGYCSSYSDGAFGSPRSTATDDDGASSTSAPEPTGTDDDDDDTPSSTGRVIQTLAPTTTSGSNNDGGNNGETGPNSAAGLKVTILGTAFAAIIAGAALIL